MKQVFLIVIFFTINLYSIDVWYKYRCYVNMDGIVEILASKIDRKKPLKIGNLKRTKTSFYPYRKIEKISYIRRLSDNAIESISLLFGGREYFLKCNEDELALINKKFQIKELK